MKDLAKWIQRHPFAAVGFTFLFTLLASLAAAADKLLIPCVVVYGLALFWLCLLIYSDRAILGVLAAALVMSVPGKAAEPPPAAIGVAGGVVVVVVGGVVVYKFVKFCQQHFPKDKKTNELAFAAAADEGSYGASFNFAPLGSCYQPDLTMKAAASGTRSVPMTFTLDIATTGGRLTLGTKAEQSAEMVQDWAGFQADVAAQGLRLTGMADGSSFYARDGVACSSDLVPIRFDFETLRVRHRVPGPSLRLRVERSTDLISWGRFMSVETPAGLPLRVVDTSPETQMFYRVIAE